MRTGRVAFTHPFLTLILALLFGLPAVAHAQNPEVAIRALQTGVDLQKAAAGAEKVAAGLAGIDRGRSLSLVLSRIQTDPALANDSDVLTFLVELGQGRIGIETRQGGLVTIADELPGQQRLVASLQQITSGSTDPAGTCNPLTQWMGSGYFPGQLPGTVPLLTQEQTLAAILRAPGDVIEIDLDGTALMPVARTIRALKATGERYDIPEFVNAEELEVLPFYTGGAFTDFVARTGMAERYPDLDWRASDEGERGEVYSYFRGQYWGGRLESDQVTPGLARFIEQAQSYGKTVVFLSGRSGGWRDPSVEALAAGGVQNPNLLIGNVGGDAETKRRAQQEIRERWGEPVAFTDDRTANRGAVLDAAPNVITVPIRVPGFSSENPIPGDGQPGISTFEIRDESLPPR